MDSSAPPKPWERGGGTLFNQETSLENPGLSGPAIGATSGGSSVIPRASNELTPALPPRPSQQGGLGAYGSGLGSGMGSYGSSYGGGYGGGYGGYGSGGYGSSMYGGGYSSGLGGGMYGSSMYGGGYGGGLGGYGNRYGMNGMNDPNMQNSFAQRAEADARHAFQSIESVVHVFGSISMMLESTFNAVYSSFRAVIGVADHFSRLKLHMTQIFSAIAVFKTLKWLFRKLMVLLRLRNAADFDENWEGAATAALSKEFGELNGKPSRWPVLIFFAMVFGGPWLIWKLLKSFTKERNDQDWANGDGDHFVAVAQHDFNAESEQEISIRRGQQIRVAPKELQPRVRGWLMGSVDGERKGLVPADYVTIKGKQRGRKQALNAAIPAIPPKNTDTAVVSQDSVWDSADKQLFGQPDEDAFASAFGKPSSDPPAK